VRGAYGWPLSNIWAAKLTQNNYKEEERKYAPNLFKVKKRMPFLDTWRDYLLAKISKIFD
jgi:hypothetical protein